MSRLFHALFALVVLLGSFGGSHGSFAATHDQCACCEDAGDFATCACGGSSATPGNRPCSPDSSTRCNTTSDRALPGRTLAIQEQDNESPRPEKRKEPQPWPTVYGEEEPASHALLPSATRGYFVSGTGNQHPADHLHRLGVLRI